MTLRMEFLRLRAVTPLGMFGADIPLASGLIIIRAENSRGKSTAVKSLLYALGMERMITARSASTVTSAMRDTLIYDTHSKAETPVLESYVSLQMSNGSGEAVTVTRWVKHDRLSDGLVRVEYGPALTRPDSYLSEDFYVGRGGSASNPRGFHQWLSRFIGWEMPILPARDGRSAPLYMEQVFPLLFVEQRRGWGGIQAQMPYFSGVSDVRRRSVEFLIDLEVGRRELERQQLQARLSELEASWKSAVKAMEANLQGEGLTLSGVPASVSLNWPPPQPITILQSKNDDWVPIEQVIENLRDQLSRRQAAPIRSVGEIAKVLEDRLQAAISRADQVRESGNLLRESILRDKGELRTIRERLESLKEDERQYQDVLVLERLGSDSLDHLDEDCPVCHQRLPASLVGHLALEETMTPQDSLAYIKQQVQLFTVMAHDSERALAAKVERWAGLRQQAAELRAEIRRLRTDLTSGEKSPSIDQVAERFLIDRRIERLGQLLEALQGLRGELMRISEEAVDVRGRLRELPREKLSQEDQRKIGLLESSFVEQLRQYDFGSFSDERLAISREDYLPRRDDFDLQADISASDSIRVVWAYLLALLEVSASAKTNHPGFLVFDEPRQQSTKGLSFAALLKRAAADAVGRQIIFATSEDLASLTSMISGLDCRLHVVDGYLLQSVRD
ncbi:hypothetical protein [Micromonospora sp. CP22]|uniref:hypothetical protein n=1 Tax=Micromonospora sp. CP22 TaxID=2580517 RepID=UPI0012BD4B3A|nr:hypothetical protein [Micromonospora sp. CP22]MTK04125.1 hypothetical protein [Micromonospora sp. CP22]